MAAHAWHNNPLLLMAAAALALAVSFSQARAMPAEAQSPDNRQAVRTGLEAAKRYCHSCHAVAPGEKSANRLAPTFLSIARKYRGRRMDGVLFFDGTVVRHPGMSEFTIEVREADGLIAWLRNLARKDRKR